jgi:hypothetical protein
MVTMVAMSGLGRSANEALGPLAWRWADAVHATSFVGLNTPDLHARLLELMRRLNLSATSQDAATGAAGVGHELVELGVASPEGLRRSLEILYDLLSVLGGDNGCVRQVCSAVAAGFCEA